MADEQNEQAAAARGREPKYGAAGWRERNRQLGVSKHVVAAVFTGENADREFTEAGITRELGKLAKHEAGTSIPAEDSEDEAA